MQHLIDYGLLTDSQHGFRAKCFCETQLLTLVDELLQGMAKGKQYYLAIMDFNNFFDVVPPGGPTQVSPRKGTVLSHKGPMPELDRRLPEEQIPKGVDGDCSEETVITSSVSQGTVLGPILFLAFIKNIQEHVNFKYQLFSEDNIIYMYRKVKPNADCDQLHQDFDSLHQAYHRNPNRRCPLK